jgi:tetratricopeptide (TPR) repeat protein
MVPIPNEIVSALIGAAAGGGISYWTYRGTLAQQRNRDIREQLIKVIELREQQGVIDAERPDNYLAVSTWINTKRGIHLAIANDLSEKAHRSMTPNDCMALGYECQLDRNPQAARDHYERALRKAKKSGLIDRVVALRYLGYYFFDVGPDQDLEEGNRYFRQAVELTRQETMPYLVFTTGVSYERWAGLLLGVGDPRWREVAQFAKAAYESLPADFAYKSDSLRSVESLLEQRAAASPAAPPPALSQEPVREPDDVR